MFLIFLKIIYIKFILQVILIFENKKIRFVVRFYLFNFRFYEFRITKNYRRNKNLE